MLYSSHAEIEDRVVELLTSGRLSVKALCSRLGEDHKISLRGVYKAVNKLVEGGVLLKVGQNVLINDEWAGKVAERLSAPIAPSISEGERLSHTFTSLDHLDAFWKSTILPLERTLEAREVFIYNPHSFWALLPGRRESEETFLGHFSEKQAGFLTIGGETASDLEFKRRYQSEYLQIDLRPLASIRRTDHITVLGPYIILTRLSKAVTDRIDKLYEAREGVEGLLPGLHKACARPGKLKLIIENNPQKAEKLRRTLARNFYFKRPD